MCVSAAIAQICCNIDVLAGMVKNYRVFIGLAPVEGYSPTRICYNMHRNRATFNGKFYRLDGAQTGPSPFHSIRIWIGAYGPKMLRLTGRLGDGWTPSYGYAPPDQIPKMEQTLEQSISATGRKGSEVRRNYNLAGTILEGDVNKEGQRQEGITMMTNGEQNGLLVSSIDFWIVTIVKFYKDLKMDSFTF